MMWNFYKEKLATVLILGTLGGALGSVILLYGYLDTPEGYPNSPEFVKVPEFMTWLFVMLVMFVFMVLVAGPLWGSLREWEKYYRSRKLEIAVSSLVYLLLQFAPGIALILLPQTSFSFPLAYFSTKLTIITLIAFFVTLPAVLGIWLIRLAVGEIFGEINGAMAEPEKVDLARQHIYLREAAQRYLIVLGGILSLIVLSTEANRVARLAYDLQPEQFPLSTVLVYGLYFVLVLVLIYTPTHLELLDAGRKLEDLIYPIHSPENLLEVAEKREKLKSFLQLKVDSMQSIRAGVAILAPLLSSMLSSLLE